MSEFQGNIRDNEARDNQVEYVQDTVKEHVFDGIEEFDNRLPNWWLWIMYGSIIFAVLYWVVFHTLEIQPLPRERLAIEMQAAEEAELIRMAESGMDNDVLVKMSEMDNKVAEGRQLFVKYCVTCHLDDGRGMVGPNLTDGKSIHGCEPMDMLKTVSDGVTAKGMPSWINQLGPSRVATVVSYVLTIRNNNVPGGKAPEGEPCSF